MLKSGIPRSKEEFDELKKNLTYANIGNYHAKSRASHFLESLLENFSQISMLIYNISTLISNVQRSTVYMDNDAEVSTLSRSLAR